MQYLVIATSLLALVALGIVIYRKHRKGIAGYQENSEFSDHLNTADNIKCRFEFICDRHWDELDSTDSENIRYCNHCSQSIFLAKTVEELDILAREKKCAFFRPDSSKDTEYLDIPPFPGRLISKDD